MNLILSGLTASKFKQRNGFPNGTLCQKFCGMLCALQLIRLKDIFDYLVEKRRPRAITQKFLTKICVTRICHQKFDHINILLLILFEFIKSTCQEFEELIFYFLDNIFKFFSCNLIVVFDIINYIFDRDLGHIITTQCFSCLLNGFE